MLKQTVIFAVVLFCLFLINRPVAAAEPQTRYYRQLVYNHVSPYVPIRGIYEISPETAQTAPHYVFRRDERDGCVKSSTTTWKMSRGATIR